MKIRMAKNLLSIATNRVQGAITERSLSQIGLHAKDSELQVAATDRALAVYSNLAAEVIQAGTVFVPARLFSDVVKELPDGLVRLDLEGAYLVITAGTSDEFTMKLPIIDELSWRDPPTIECQVSADVPALKLAYMIEQVQFCVAQDSPRNYGTVAFLHRPDQDTCRLVGTDGFRLSYCEVKSPLPDGFLKEGVCLSKRALAELERMCSEGFEKVSLSLSSDGTTLLARVPDYQVYIRLSSVKYPNYMGVIPERQLMGVSVTRSHIQNVTRRVLLAADKSRALQLSFSDSSLTLNSKTMGSSEGREKVPLPDYQGDRFDIAVNGKFLMDVFATTESESLTLFFNHTSSEDPIVIEPKQELADCRSKHVLVPIRQND
jgi:DNA polymerase-3 subunit beta